MADYLTKLASRALGVALTAQPVVPSIFAPEPPLAEAISIAWSVQHSQEGLDLEAPGWSLTSSQAMRRELAGPAASPEQADLDDAGSADAWTASDLSPSPAWPAEPDPRSSQGLLLQPVGEGTEGRPAPPAGQLGGQASPAVGPAAGVGVVQRQSDAAAHRLAGAPDLSAPERLADTPRTSSSASNVRATQQSLHAPSGDTSGMPLFVSGGTEARPAPPAASLPAASAERAGPQAAVSPAARPPAASRPVTSAGRTAPRALLPTNWPASAATPERVTVTRALQPEEAGVADLAQNADAGDDPAGFGLLLPAESEQAWRLSPEALTQRVSREQVSSHLAPAPVIEVTIGRVVVRAVQADRQTGKPKAAAPPGPPLSLEAYLRQQRGNQS